MPKFEFFVKTGFSGGDMKPVNKCKADLNSASEFFSIYLHSKYEMI